MLNIPYILGSDERCIEHTGVNLVVFAYIVLQFWPAYEDHMNALYIERHGKPRKRALGGWCGWRLKSLEDKVFFILYYLKTYQTYATLWWVFDLGKPKAYEWVKMLLPPLFSALKKTVWYLQPHQQNWKKSWQNIPRWKMSGSIEWSEMSPEVPNPNTKKKITQAKRKNTPKNT